jgi:hypothetical protein
LKRDRSRSRKPAAKKPRKNPESLRRRALIRDVVIIAGLHAFACAWARSAGFDHVSDDDFSRVTIAQAIAHAPKLDPSGTSWLPFPFWITGGLMALVGRSLDAARAIAILLSSLAAAMPYLALRAAGVVRGRAFLATAFAFITPWCIWLGATTVPESFTASLAAAGVIGAAAVLGRERPPEVDESVISLDDLGLLIPAAPRAPVKAFILSALVLLVATLSRYEPWPVAAVVAISFAVGAVGTDRARRPLLIGAAVLCALGPLLWMAWNAHAHDGPLHFFRRVSTFKRAIGDGATSTTDALLLYPKLLFTSRPEVAIPTVFLLVPALRDEKLRRRWAMPLLCVITQLVFLAYGNARDGAPAHHPERALLGTLVLLALFVGDAGPSILIGLVRTGLRFAAKAAAACIAVAWVVATARNFDMPGNDPSEDRKDAIARGEKLRAEGAAAIVVTPCAFEHFALIAAYGSPENAEIRDRLVTVHMECPQVELR